MKKTLITLLALSGVAAADTLTISNANNTAATTGNWFATLSATAENVTSSNTFTATDYTNSFYSVATNVGNGGSYDYVLTFTLKQNITLTDFKFDVFFHNSDGCTQGKNRTAKCAITLFPVTNTTEPLYSKTDVLATSNQPQNGNGDASYNGSAYDENGELIINTTTAWQADGSRVATANIAMDNGITLTTGTSYNLKIHVESGDAQQGMFVGIGNITMNGQVVPEPTTATLSLLALCGLAARRRRK